MMHGQKKHQVIQLYCV